MFYSASFQKSDSWFYLKFSQLVTILANQVFHMFSCFVPYKKHFKFPNTCVYVFLATDSSEAPQKTTTVGLTCSVAHKPKVIYFDQSVE